MAGSSTYNFAEPDAFRAGLGLLGVRAFVAMPGAFSARLTQATLPHSHLLRVAEVLPRIAYFSLPADAVWISFLTHPDPPAIWAGEEMHFGDIMFHGSEQRLHQWISAPCRWGVVALEARFFARHAKVHYDIDFAASAIGRILRPTAAAGTQLLDLHTRASHVVETDPSVLVHPEAARSLENDLIYALADCIAQGDWLDMSPARRLRAEIMDRFENEVASGRNQAAKVAEICKGMGVSERTLQLCCRQFLGIGPARYIALRRLVRLRSAIFHADRLTANVDDIARLHGFASAAQIRAPYRSAFGETPSKTLQRDKAAWG